MRPLSSFLFIGAIALAIRAGAQSPLATPAASAPVSSVSGTVFDSLVANSPLAGASVWIVGTPRSVVTDADGAYRFDSLPPGTYTLTFSAPALDSVGVSAPTVDVVTAEGGAPVVALATPSPATFYASACGAVLPPDVGVVFGVVRDAERTAPVANAQVTAEWVEWVLEGGGLQQRDAKIGIATDATGHYRLCGVPADIAVVLRAQSGASGTGAVEIDLVGRSFATRDLGMTAPVSSGAGAAGPRGFATLTGRVTGSEGQPVARAHVSVLGQEGSAVTDSLGTFVLGGLPAGTHTVEARALGFSPVHLAVDLAAQQTTRIAPRFEQRVVVLSRERIFARGPAGLADRQRRGVGEVIGREQIERSNALNLNDVLRWSPRLSTSAASGNPTSRRSAGRCAPAYYVDGVELSPGGITTPDHRVAGAPLGGVITPDQVITARDVEAVEVYGEAGAPVTSTRSSGCGALMIWTRDTLPGGRTRRSNRQ